jgi:predicted RND superfamily exporter protein
MIQGWTAGLARCGEGIAKHPGIAHGVLFLLVALAAFDLRSVRVDPDWFALLRPNDPVLQSYRQYAANGEGGRTLHLKWPAGATQPPQDVLGDIPGIETIRPLPLPQPRGDGALWFAAVLVPSENPDDYSAAAQAVRHQAGKAGIQLHLTGAPVMLEEYRLSVMHDFSWTSVLSLLLVAALLSTVLRSLRAVAWGVLYELAGLTIATALCVRLTGDLNMLSAALPCVLIGLGADFVIHCIAIARHREDSHGVAKQLYAQVARPMLGGALTTAAAFASLALADLRGLRSVGILGAAGVLLMFLAVILFLPARLESIRWAKQVNSIPTWLPRGATARRSIGLAFAAVCLFLSLFAGRLRTEDRLDHLYDPRLPSLELQAELADDLGVYPSPLFLSVDAERVLQAAEKLADPNLPFRIQADPASMPLSGPVVLPLFAKDNPFAEATFARLEAELAELLGGRDAFVLTGEASVSLHLNELLQRGMKLAFAAVIVVLLLVLVGMFRQVRLVAGPLAVLLLAVCGILGLMALLDIRLSAYTLTLFPLFVGIGVDDCLYVADLSRAGKTLRESPDTLLAITLTTATTVFGYGSLLVTSNPGFRAMGATATIGLLLMYAGAIYALPALLRARD